MDWEDDGACRSVGYEAFFLEKAMNATQAKKICARCPVKRECLDQAMRIEGAYRYGIWGGTTPTERKALAAAERALLSD
jgi:WhiB family redox-sensing transcriptional regulator